MTGTRRPDRKAGSVGLQLPRRQLAPGTDSGGSLMGWQLVREAEDHGPDGLTWRERFALSVLANAAMDSTRECPRGIEDNPDIIRRLRLGRSERFSVIAALCKKGALIQVERGRNGSRAVYGIAPFAALAYLNSPESANAPVGNPVDNPLKHPEFPDPSGDVASGNPGPLRGPEGSGIPGLKHPEFPDPSGDDTVFFRGDMIETGSISHARAREAVRLAFPGLNDREIGETLRIVQARYHPTDMTKYIRTLIDNGDLTPLIPCGLNDRMHSDRCRNRDCVNCTASWCQGRCHDRNAAGEWSA